MLECLAMQVFSHPLFKIRLEIRQIIIILDDKYVTGRVMLADLGHVSCSLIQSGQHLSLSLLFPCKCLSLSESCAYSGPRKGFSSYLILKLVRTLFYFYFCLIFYSLRFAFEFLFHLPVLESFALLIFKFSFSLNFGIHSKTLISLSALINYENSIEDKEIKHRTSPVRGTQYKTIKCYKPKIPA